MVEEFVDLGVTGDGLEDDDAGDETMTDAELARAGKTRVVYKGLVPSKAYCRMIAIENAKRTWQNDWKGPGCSIPVKIAKLTEVIRALTIHCRENYHDYLCRRRLIMRVADRRRLLDTLSWTNVEGYLKIREVQTTGKATARGLARWHAQPCASRQEPGAVPWRRCQWCQHTSQMYQQFCTNEMGMAVNRDKEVYFAKLAEQAERYDEMATHMEAVGKSGDELSVEERNLLSVAYKNAVGSRRAAWRIITSVEQKETSKGNEENAKFAKEYCKKVEGELDDICKKILAVLDNSLIGKATTGESQVFYQKMKADYYRYIAEYTTGADKEKASNDAKLAYEEAQAIATKDLAVTHPIRLGLALNFSVFQYEVLANPDEACKMARTAFEDAIAELDNVAEDSYKDSTLIMQLLRDNLTLWTSDQGGRAPQRGAERAMAVGAPAASPFGLATADFVEPCTRAVMFSLANFLYDQAVFFAERLVAHLPDSDEALRMLAAAHLHSGDAARVRVLLQGGAARTPQLRYLLALSCMQLGKPEEAEAALLGRTGGIIGWSDGVAGCGPGLYLLGQARERLGRPEDAAECYAKCLDVCPFMWCAYERLSWLGTGTASAAEGSSSTSWAAPASHGTYFQEDDLRQDPVLHPCPQVAGSPRGLGGGGLCSGAVASPPRKRRRSSGGCPLRASPGLGDRGTPPALPRTPRAARAPRPRSAQRRPMPGAQSSNAAPSRTSPARRRPPRRAPPRRWGRCCGPWGRCCARSAGLRGGRRCWRPSPRCRPRSAAPRWPRSWRRGAASRRGSTRRPRGSTRSACGRTMLHRSVGLDRYSTALWHLRSGAELGRLAQRSGLGQAAPAGLVRRRELLQPAGGARPGDPVFPAGHPGRPSLHVRLHAAGARVHGNGEVRQGRRAVRARSRGGPQALQCLVGPGERVPPPGGVRQGAVPLPEGRRHQRQQRRAADLPRHGVPLDSAATGARSRALRRGRGGPRRGGAGGLREGARPGRPGAPRGGPGGASPAYTASRRRSRRCTCSWARSTAGWVTPARRCCTSRRPWTSAAPGLRWRRRLPRPARRLGGGGRLRVRPSWDRRQHPNPCLADQADAWACRRRFHRQGICINPRLADQRF
ncbi:unnamed protein product, partial [Prorocentrum cordatum]